MAKIKKYKIPGGKVSVPKASDMGKGWYGEYLRHSLAARGIKTGEMKRFKVAKLSIPKIILTNMKKARRPLTIKEISDRTGLSWPTVKGHIEELNRKGKVKKKMSGTREYWKL